MRYSKRRVSKRRSMKRSCKRHAKRGCKTSSKQRVSKSYTRRHVMKGGWGGASIMDTVMKPFKNDDEEKNASIYGGWGEVIN